MNSHEIKPQTSILHLFRTFKQILDLLEVHNWEVLEFKEAFHCGAPKKRISASHSKSSSSTDMLMCWKHKGTLYSRSASSVTCIHAKRTVGKSFSSFLLLSPRHVRVQRRLHSCAWLGKTTTDESRVTYCGVKRIIGAVWLGTIIFLRYFPSTTSAPITISPSSSTCRPFCVYRSQISRHSFALLFSLFGERVRI